MAVFEEDSARTRFPRRRPGAADELRKSLFAQGPVHTSLGSQSRRAPRRRLDVPDCALVCCFVEGELDAYLPFEQADEWLARVCDTAESMLCQCPTQLRASLSARGVRIELCGSEKQRRLAAFTDGEAARYEHETCRIVLAFYSEAELCSSASSLVHELGHAIFDALAQSMRSEVVSAYNSAVADGKYSDLPSGGGYMLTNEDEYFACSCELFLRGGRPDIQMDAEELRQRDPRLAAVLASIFGAS